MILMMRLTKTFGPMITMIQAMFGTLSVFFGIWIPILFMFASAGMFIFGVQLEQYQDLFNALD
jgi:hypothetical protein